jgi:ribosomal protein S12 methylthiotransferase
MKIHMVNLGCARNLVDGELMMGGLQRSGLELTDTPEDADAIVVNTCSFIEAAADESIDTILELSALKKTGRCRRLVVAGCLPERYRDDIHAALPEVDVFLGTGAYDRIIDAVRGDVPLDKGACFPDPDRFQAGLFEADRPITTGHVAYVKITEGCDRHCTYCIIPRLRGRQRSRPAASLCAEARALVEKGARELILVGQETTRYGSDLPSGETLAALLVAMAGQCPEAWIRTLYGHPESLGEDAIEAIASHSNLCSYFDIPIQHASDSVLKRMGRRYTGRDVVAMAARIRGKIPDAALRTTVIVGFPGETEADFRALESLVETVRFHHLGVFAYSDADDLPSHRLPDPVESAVAEERRERLMTLQKRISETINEGYLDRQLSVMVDEFSEPGLYIGRTAFQAPEVDGLTYVHTPPDSQPWRPGDIVDVTITDTLEYDLIGEAR